MICEAWDVVVVPFPFSDKRGAKRRPALTLSKAGFNEHGHSVLAMITTSGHSPWPGDIDLGDRKAAGLRVPCVVRLKLFTLDNRLILKKIGRLSADDREGVLGQMRANLW
ncbi:MAG: type II toxin-antitoxin system PemK/MazF family toxin [Candidatus Binatia bacterium]